VALVHHFPGDLAEVEANLDKIEQSRYICAGEEYFGDIFLLSNDILVLIREGRDAEFESSQKVGLLN
jgi:hypothetical protein